MTGLRGAVQALACLAALLTACANPYMVPKGSTARQVYRENNPARFVYANYCGLGTRQGDLSAAPLDRLDAACLEHDVCYIEGRNDRCACNRALVVETERIISDRSVPGAVRRRAGLVRTFFVSMVPVCTMFPRGVTRPRKKDVLEHRYRGPKA